MKIRKNLNVIIMLIIVLLPFIYYGNIIFSGKMLYGTDWIDAGGYIKRAFVENAQDRYGEFPLWNPNVFTGIPTGEGFLGDIFYPISLFLKLFLPLFIAWTLIFVIHPVFAGIGMYLFIKEKIKNRWIGLFAAIVYMFTSVILSETYAGHDGRVIVACYLPLLIYFLDRGFHMKRIGYFGIASLIASLMLLSGHIQSSYYAIVLGIFYISFIHINNEYKHRFRNYTWLAALLIGFLFSFIDRYVGFGAFVLLIIFSPILLDREFQRTSVKIYGGLLLFIILTAVISAVQYMPILRYLPYTARGLSRGYSYATSWSMGLSEIVDMVFPGFTGITQEGMNSYWGANPFKLHFRYIGIIPMLLALSAIFLKKKSAIEKFMIISFFTGIIIALGGDTPIYRIFYNLFPYFNKFRAPDLAFFITSFSATVLAAYYLNRITGNLKILTIVSSVVAGLGLILIIAPGVLTSIMNTYINGFELQAQAIAQKSNIMHTTINSMKGTAFFIVIVTALFYLAVRYLDRKYFTYLLIGITLFSLGELWLRNRRFIKTIPAPNRYYSKDRIADYLEDQKGLFRVLPVNYNQDDYLSLFDIHSVSGSHPSPFHSYQKFVNNPNSVMFNAMALMNKPERIKMLNVKYLIFPAVPQDTVGYGPRDKQAIIQYNNLIASAGFENRVYLDRYMICENKDALPRIYAVNDYIINDDLESTLSLIDNNQFDKKHSAVVEKDFEINIAPDSGFQYSIDDIEYTPNRIAFEITANQNCLVIVGDQFYKPWDVTVDGNSKTLIRANGIFRSVAVKEGTHTIIMKYNSSLQIIALILSILGIVALIIIFIVEKRIIKNRRDHNRD